MNSDELQFSLDRHFREIDRIILSRQDQVTIGVFMYLLTAQGSHHELIT